MGEYTTGKEQQRSDFKPSWFVELTLLAPKEDSYFTNLPFPSARLKLMKPFDFAGRRAELHKYSRAKLVDLQRDRPDSLSFVDFCSVHHII